MPEYRHATGAFQVNLPDGWRADESIDNCALVAVDPIDDFGFHANIVVTVEEVLDAADRVAMFPDHIRAVREGLTSTRIIDAASAQVSGFPAQRVLLHHETPGDAITLEQWFLPVGRYAWYLSASVASLSYDYVADVLHDIVASFELLEPSS